MLEKLFKFIKEKQLFGGSDKILLAVSGGVDSMVLLHLFEQSDFHFGVVHCNFKLRGDDSDEDEKFVEQHVLNKGISYYSTQFDTTEFARINGMSVEMAARELRYEFFEEIRKAKGYDFIATAHHKDDLLETFFLNLSRKTGIKGLTGIKEKSGKVIRPLLFASRREIDNYAQQEGVETREDASNSEVVFQRNFIRHKVLPELSGMNPAFKRNLAQTIRHLREAESVYTYYLNIEREKVISFQESIMIVNIDRLIQTPFPKVLLFEILSEYHFNPALISQIYDGLNSESGRSYYGKRFRLIKDRRELFLVPQGETGQQVFYIEEGDIEIFEPIHLTVQRFRSQKFQIEKSPSVACIDMNKVDFPLLIRKWKSGDCFQPLGMTGFKKLSDFFIDRKIPIHQKENIWLLCSGQNIVWVIGQRLDNRYKITPKTTEVMRIEINS